MRRVFERALLLNSTYEPLGVIRWQDAMRLICLDKASALSYDEENPIKTSSGFVARPSVLRLNERAPIYHGPIRYSRKGVFARDDHQCLYCGSCSSLTIDHILPRSRGGMTTWENVATACRGCNEWKGSLTPEEAGMRLSKRPFAPRWQDAVAVSEQWRPWLW